jgi:Ran GTPase-activating protein (RanGAP) involved in mRNA processing and transport
MKDYIVDVMNIWKQTSFTCSLDLLSISLLSENPGVDGYGEYVVSAMAQGNLNWCIHYCYQGMRYAERCFNAIMYHDQYEAEEEVKEEENPSPVVEEKTLEEKKKEAEDIAIAKMEQEAKEVAEENVELPF